MSTPKSKSKQIAGDARVELVADASALKIPNAATRAAMAEVSTIHAARRLRIRSYE